MNEVDIWCDQCDKLITKEIDELQDVFGMICPVCGSDEIWIRNLRLDYDKDNDEPIKMGRGGCTQK